MITLLYMAIGAILCPVIGISSIIVMMLSDKDKTTGGAYCALSMMLCVPFVVLGAMVGYFLSL